jgi:hypothetical protein
MYPFKNFTLALNSDLTQGLYPTIIIILVSKQMSPVDALGPPTDDGMP